ncbi:hypothetical protein PBY51_020380 [Eleginops maclovinus]|uniref:Uncharacterized protein n=1 Tax=Eleginops maclovinus TaxID=56733 RepID=A0AAN7XUG7_ELEMC|nr:hypothetical protein PBY51_020380 [Eleginops maclovinus]
MTNMIAIARASEDSRYPTRYEVTSMAKRLVEYYPMIKEKSSDSVWEDVSKRLMKRLSNIKSPVKSKVPPAKKQRQDWDADESLSSHPSDCDSIVSTVILETSPRTSTPKRDNQVSRPGDSEDESFTLTVPEPMDSEKTQARHYRTLQTMFESKKPNKAAVSQLLNLEFPARRKFIDSDTIREQQRPGKILEAYPCFRDLDHIMDEFRRIVETDNIDFLINLRERRDSFYGKVQYYGVMKRVMKPPLTMDFVEHAIACLHCFTAALSIKLEGTQPNRGNFHVLTPSENPDAFLRTQACPIVLLGEENCLLAIEATTLCTFPREKFHETLLYLMACYYVFHLTYPKTICTLLSVIQTEVVGDKLHDGDVTPSYRKSIGEWKAFLE